MARLGSCGNQQRGILSNNRGKGSQNDDEKTFNNSLPDQRKRHRKIKDFDGENPGERETIRKH